MANKIYQFVVNHYNQSVLGMVHADSVEQAKTMVESGQIEETLDSYPSEKYVNGYRIEDIWEITE